MESSNNVSSFDYYVVFPFLSMTFNSSVVIVDKQRPYKEKLTFWKLRSIIDKMKLGYNELGYNERIWPVTSCSW